MDSPANWLVGIDIGGTFTDVVAVDRTGGETRTGKVVTRSGDRVASLVAALAAVGLDWAEVGDLVHGTTMITNAIVQADFARTALIATAGFADTLAIGRQNRRHLYRLDPAEAHPARSRRTALGGRRAARSPRKRAAASRR